METLPTHSPNQLPTTSEKMQLALAGKRINECTDEEIKEALRYGIMLIGIPKDKHGDDFSKMVLNNFIRNTFPMFRLDEVRLAFEFAVAKKTKPNHKLVIYPGEIISARYIAEIIEVYIELKKSEKIKPATTPSIPMNNVQRSMAIVGLLSPEFKEVIRKAGSAEDKLKESQKLPFHDVHQKWFRQFDKLFLKYECEEIKSGRWINRYGKPHNVEMYFNKKIEQLQMAKIRNEDKL